MTYSSVCGLETVEALLGALPLLLCNYALQSLLCELPELVVLFFDEEDDSGWLRVEGRRDMEHDLLDNVLDLLIGDGRFLLESIDGTAGLDKVEELLGLGCHCCGGGKLLGMW